MLRIDRQNRANVLVLCLTGNLDALTVGDLKVEIDRVMAAQTKACVVDMSGVVLVDSSGVGAIISLFKRLRATGGDLKVASVTGQPKEIFDLLRLDRALSLYPNVEAAVSHFTK